MVQGKLVCWFGSSSEWWDVVESDGRWFVEQVDAGADGRIAHRTELASFAFKDDAVEFAKMFGGE